MWGYGEGVPAQLCGLRPLSLVSAVLNQAAPQLISLFGGEIRAGEKLGRERVSLSQPARVGQDVQLVVSDLPSAEPSDGAIAFGECFFSSPRARQQFLKGLGRGGAGVGMGAKAHHALIEAPLAGVVPRGENLRLDVVNRLCRPPGCEVLSSQVAEGGAF